MSKVTEMHEIIKLAMSYPRYIALVFFMCDDDDDVQLSSVLQ